MSSNIPRVAFNNGHSCPILGLGTWLSKPNEVEEAVKTAITCGYRHLDCAYAYFNEDEVGVGIEAKIQDGTVERSDLFVTSKLWPTFLNPKLVLSGVKESLTKLRLDYLDLFLIHWPVSFKEGGEAFPKGPDGKLLFADVDYLDTWKAMEDLVDQGLVRSIGVSNFNLDQMQRLLSNSRIKPAICQIEIHPFLLQKPLVEYCKSQGVAVTAYSPLGTPSSPNQPSSNPHLMSDPTVVSIAEKKNKTPAQVLIRCQIQNGNIVIPKSVTKSRIESNIQVFDFELSADEMEQLEKMNINKRYCCFPGIQGHPNYPFTELLS